VSIPTLNSRLGSRADAAVSTARLLPDRGVGRSAHARPHEGSPSGTKVHLCNVPTEVAINLIKRVSASVGSLTDSSGCALRWPSQLGLLAALSALSLSALSLRKSEVPLSLPLHSGGIEHISS